MSDFESTYLNIKKTATNLIFFLNNVHVYLFPFSPTFPCVEKEWTCLSTENVPRLIKAYCQSQVKSDFSPHMLQFPSADNIQ